VSGVAVANLLVSRIVVFATHVANDYILDAFELHVRRIKAPKAATAENE
jgi:hypothetical protein